MSKTWFITGSSRGFGREFTEAALRRGDRVAATARRLESVQDFADRYGDAVLPLVLDVTDRDAARRAVETAYGRFGGLDVVVNNAGYGLLGALEELDPDDLRREMDTNYFGALWVTQAALPLLRSQGSGHIVQISSIGGLTAFPTGGAYSGTKWALEAMSEALAGEVAPFGIHVTLIEPGGFSTDFGGDSMTHAHQIAAYQPAHDVIEQQRHGQQPGDPAAAAQVLLEIVDSDEPPLRALFGKGVLDRVKKVYADRLAGWEQGQPAAEKAHG